MSRWLIADDGSHDFRRFDRVFTRMRTVIGTLCD
ncbi:hypothetical protein H4W30_005818 [Amycolatopsis roodepoortensis]|uniref:Uncharacterized protein n=1 Tax=Amycolatopsis roodepoortensis TaxID=700274 RepID=A0ABR9LF23_9PSEU|nr:hypothetical protein [Amycolatopsis roodepoortensis]